MPQEISSGKTAYLHEAQEGRTPRMSTLPSVAPNHPAPRRRPRGFTLLEILVVIVVIAILATLVAPNVFRHVGTAQDATARTQIEMLGAALDAYRLDNGRYPTNEQGLAALWTEPQLEPRARTAGWPRSSGRQTWRQTTS